MIAYNPNDIIIHGTTSNGKIFRPSDWAERLCGILSSFNKDHRLAYHEWVRPILIDKVRSVAIDAKLEEINPSMFRFLMDFAADNDLRVMNATELEALTTSNPQPIPTPAVSTPEPTSGQPVSSVVEESKHEVAAPIESSKESEKTMASEDFVVREITPEETATAFGALSVLRPMLTDINGFVNQVNKIQRAEGYRLLGVFETGKTHAVAVCGFRERTNLVSGRHMHIDDLVTVPQCRKHGYAGLLLNEVYKIATESGLTKIQVASNVNSDRTKAHRLYFQHGFEISAYHFVRQIENP